MVWKFFLYFFLDIFEAVVKLLTGTMLIYYVEQFNLPQYFDYILMLGTFNWAWKSVSRYFHIKHERKEKVFKGGKS